MEKVEVLKKQIHRLERKIENIQCTPTCGDYGESCCRGRRSVWYGEIIAKKKEIEKINLSYGADNKL